MFGLGNFEILLILVFAIILFGPKRIPEIARSLGRFMAKVRKMGDDLKDEIDQGMNETSDQIIDSAPKKTDIDVKEQVKDTASKEE